eukprot:256278_1
MTFCAQLLIALVAIMAKLPPSFNTQVHKYGERLTMNNIKRWTIDQIIEYNEFNHDNAQVQIVKYKCGAIGQKVGTKTHAKKCRNGCDVNDLTIRFMDNENNSWKDEEKYKGFAKGACLINDGSSDDDLDMEEPSNDVPYDVHDDGCSGDDLDTVEPRNDVHLSEDDNDVVIDIGTTNRGESIGDDEPAEPPRKRFKRSRRRWNSKFSKRPLYKECHGQNFSE